MTEKNKAEEMHRVMKPNSRIRHANGKTSLKIALEVPKSAAYHAYLEKLSKKHSEVDVHSERMSRMRLMRHAYHTTVHGDHDKVDKWHKDLVRVLSHYNTRVRGE